MWISQTYKYLEHLKKSFVFVFGFFFGLFVWGVLFSFWNIWGFVCLICLVFFCIYTELFFFKEIDIVYNGRDHPAPLRLICNELSIHVALLTREYLWSSDCTLTVQTLDSY